MESLPREHRRVLASIRERLLNVHGPVLQPRKFKLLEHTTGAYELQALGPQMAVTAVQLRTLAKLEHVSCAYVDCSVHDLDVRGAICVLVNLSDAATAARREERDAELPPAKSRSRAVNTDDDDGGGGGGWLSKLFGR